KKRRINKKWLRRYGYTERDIQPDGSAYMFEGKLYMTKRDFERLKEEINDGKNQKTYRGRFQGSEGASDIQSF
ncbi:MAG: hypothetical protein IK123_00435, partial [Lachnospiraceae bacterium]|nr:hypothetical protein [Lachnospiraceae bacterium]